MLRLLAISLFILWMIFMVGLYARNSGLEQQYSTFSHPMLDTLRSSKSPIGIATKQPAGSPTENSRAWFDWWIHEQKAAFVKVSVHSTNKPKLVLLTSDAVKLLAPKKVEHFEDPEDLNLPFLTLEEIYTNYPTTMFLLDIKSNTSGIHHAIAESLKQIPDSKNRTIIMSDYSVIIETTRQLLAEWIFASGKPTMVRFLTLVTLWLEPIATLPTDFIYLEYPAIDKSPINTRTTKEILRRNKLPFFGPDLSPSDLDSLKMTSTFLFLTSDPSLVRKVAVP